MIKIDAKLKKLLNSSSIISFDIFDTLLVRPYFKPTDLFMHLEYLEQRNGFALARIEAEKKARKIYKEQEDVSLEQIYEQIETEFKNLQNKEMELEAQTLQPNPLIKPIFDYAKKCNKTIIVTSSMYLPKIFLTKVLKDKGYTDIKKVYVSCDIGKNKRSGNIYRYIADDLNVKMSDIVHIGDNKLVDYTIPQSLGIKCIYIPKIMDNFLQSNPRVSLFLDKFKNEIGASIFIGVMAINHARISTPLSRKDYFQNIGYEYGGIFAYQYMYWLNQEITKDNIKDVMFISRDGYTFKRVFDMIKNKNINSYYIYAPRFVSLISTLDYNKNNWEHTSTISNYYRKKLGVSSRTKTGKEYLQQDLDFIDNNISKIKDLSIIERKKYQKYFESFNISGTHIGCVDIGSVFLSSQKLLELGAIDKVVHGYYWRLNKKADINNHITKKFDIEDISRNIYHPWDFAELLFTAPEYPIQNIKDNRPIYKKVKNKYEDYRIKIYPYISDGCVNFARDIINIFNDKNTFFTAFQSSFWTGLLRNTPNNIDKKYFQNIKHAYDIEHRHYKNLFDWTNSDKSSKLKLWGWKEKENKKYFYILGIPILKQSTSTNILNYIKTKTYICGIKIAVKYKNNFRRIVNILGIKIKYKNRKKYHSFLFEQIRKNLRFSPDLSLDMKKFYLIEMGKKSLHYTMNLDNPKTFNEKLNWLKLHYHNSLLTICADKYKMRSFVEKEIGKEFLIPLIGVWDNVEDIDFQKLPSKFVLKVNWGSGQNIICKDKSQLNIDEVKRKLKKWMEPQSNHYYYSFEWCYKDIRPKIIAEEYIEQLNSEVYDYKIFCFNGKPEILYIAVDSYDYKIMRINYYDTDFNLLPFIKHYPNTKEALQKPRFYKKMLEISKKLSKQFPFVRIDFYDTGSKVYVGEITFYPGGGLDAFEPYEWDEKLGNMMKLS